MDVPSVFAVVMRRFRRRRLRQFRELFPDVGRAVRLLDVGGAAPFWDNVDLAARITILNVDPAELSAPARTRCRAVIGDGRCLPFRDRSFDVVVSNSVIEHITTAADQRVFASEMRRVGRRLYCQTPNRWFPVEPHVLGLFVHWFPPAAQRRLIRWMSMWGWLERPAQSEVDAFIEGLRLLTRGDLARLFPDCELRRETFLGLTKSLIVVRL